MKEGQGIMTQISPTGPTSVTSVALVTHAMGEGLFPKQDLSSDRPFELFDTTKMPFIEIFNKRKTNNYYFVELYCSGFVNFNK